MARPLVVAVALVVGGLASAAPASAGCEDRGRVQYCDQPERPDGTWDRCRIFIGYGVSGIGDYQPTQMRCYPINPNKLWWGGEPPYHIDP